MYQQINENAYLDKVINMVEKVREELVAMKKEATATTVEEIIEHEGLKLRKVNRGAQEGDYVRPNAYSESIYILKDQIYGPVSKRLTIPDSDGKHWDVYKSMNNRIPSTVEVFEVVKEITPEDLPFPEVELSANQRRAVVIQEAKRFIASKVKNGLVQIGDKTYKAHFHRKGRTVSCVLNDSVTGYTTYVDTAKCGPADVFNEHLGQAIALGRIIGTPKQMFLKAVQPNEIVVGHLISNELNDEIQEITSIVGDQLRTDGTELYWEKRLLKDGIIAIIDDTNTKYGEVN